MEDNLFRLLDRRYLCRTGASIGLGNRQDRFHSVANRLGNSLEIGDLYVILVCDGIFEASWIGRRLRLSENRFHRAESRLALAFLAIWWSNFCHSSAPHKQAPYQPSCSTCREQ